jgi:hypothetical protein
MDRRRGFAVMGVVALVVIGAFVYALSQWPSPAYSCTSAGRPAAQKLDALIVRSLHPVRSVFYKDCDSGGPAYTSFRLSGRAAQARQRIHETWNCDARLTCRTAGLRFVVGLDQARPGEEPGTYAEAQVLKP